MNRPLFKRVSHQVLALMASVAFCGVMALAQGQAPAAGQRTDGQIEMDVVHALDASQTLKNDLITAATIQSEVTLSGTVSSDSSRALAESIVKGVPGVTAVHNNLKVGNPAAAPSMPAGDAGSQDMADNGPPEVAPESGGQNPAPDYGQSQQPAYGQNSGPSYGQQAPPPDYGQNSGPGYGQAPPPTYGGNQYPGGRRNPYPGAQQPYPQQYGDDRQRDNQPAYENQPAYQIANGPVTLPEGTLIQVRTSEAVSSKRAVEGTPVQFTVIRDVNLGGVLAIPRGATVHGVVTGVQRTEPGALGGSSKLALQLISLDLSGQNYPLRSDLFMVKSPNKAGRTVGSAFGGAVLGALIGGAAGGGTGAAIGAVAGGGAGTVASAASSGPNAWIPAEALVTFHLMSPVTVNPVSQEEANQLAQGLNQGGPRLQRRYYGRPYGYGAPYPYPYAPVYYRPYYSMGGFYYWR